MGRKKKTDYGSLTTRRQVLKMREVAEIALEQYGLQGSEIRLLYHGFNTTFRVTSRDGRRVALRINVNSHRSPEEMRAEVEWVTAIARETEVKVPVPLLTKSGQGVGNIWSPELEREFYCVAYSWLEGADAGDKVTPRIAEAMGAALKALHCHAESFKFSDSAKLTPISSCLYMNPFTIDTKCDTVDHGVYREVIARADDTIRYLQKRKPIPIHSDLHMANVKWHKGELAVFDFDDSIMGWPIVDAFVSLFYLRRFAPEVEAHFWKGLGSVPTDHGISDAQFEALVASRAVLLANDLFAVTTAELVEIAPRYAIVTEQRLRNYLETGKFDPKSAPFK